MGKGYMELLGAVFKLIKVKKKKNRQWNIQGEQKGQKDVVVLKGGLQQNGISGEPRGAAPLL